MLRDELKSIWTSDNLHEFQKFGETMGVFLVLVGLAFYFIDYNNAYVVLTAGALVFLMGWIRPGTLRPVFAVWMSFAIILGFIVTRIILGVIFFIIFSPVGLVFRLINKDHLDEALDPEASSYWRKRERKHYEPGMSEKQS